MYHRIISTLLLIATLVVNYLSSSWALGENLTNLREVFPFEYMPVWATFGIARGSIYIALTVRCIRSWTTSAATSQTLKNITPRFWRSSIVNILRILATARERYAISVVLIATLMLILRQIIKIISRSTETTSPRWIMSLPFGLYAWWVTMATTVIGIWQLVYTLWSDLPTTTWWMIAVIIFGISVASRLFYTYRNIGQLVITIVALIGIALSIFG